MPEALVKTTASCTRKRATLIFPQDRHGLYDEFLKGNCISDKIVDVILRALKKRKRSTVEVRGPRACLWSQDTRITPI